MARGQDAKARRKAARKEAREGNLNEFDQPPEEDEADDSEKEPEMPLPPSMSGKESSADDSDSSDQAQDSDDDAPKTRKSKSKKARTRQQVTPAKKEGIKTLPLIMLLLLTGTTLLPAMLYLGDKFGEFAQKKHLLGNLGFRLGVGPSPKKRVMSFYEKHDPHKLDEIPTILAKYYGDYPKLVKRLERKYGDYGYFINWEEDEAPMTLAFDQLKVTAEKAQDKWDEFAPEFAKTGARNIKHNFTFLYKRVNKVWKKQVWPLLEPYFGVPDAKAAREQKRADARAAQDAKPGRRKKNKDYRDDVED